MIYSTFRKELFFLIITFSIVKNSWFYVKSYKNNIKWYIEYGKVQFQFTDIKNLYIFILMVNPYLCKDFKTCTVTSEFIFLILAETLYFRSIFHNCQLLIAVKLYLNNLHCLFRWGILKLCRAYIYL